MNVAMKIVLLATFGAPLAALPHAVAAVDQTSALRETHARGGIPNVLAKLNVGSEVRVAYLGGSITEANGWRPLTTAWLQKQFPDAKIVESNAAISGTGSNFGAHRLKRDVLEQKPDLLFVEFAVNDGGQDTAIIERGMEGIVRQTWNQNPHADICFVYTIPETEVPKLQAGKLARSVDAMERVASHYGIPSIHLGIEVAKLIGEGKLLFTGPIGNAVTPFSGDGIHPYPSTGHPFYLAAIQRSFPVLQAVTKVAPHTLPAPLRADNWETARLVSPGEVTRTGSWQKLDTKANPLPVMYARRMPEIWKAAEPGDAVTFRFRGQAFGFGGAKGPDSGTFAVTVDGGAPVKTTLFDSFSREDRYRIKPWFYPQPLGAGEHTVRIELLAEAPPKADILQKAGFTMADPSKFSGNNLYVGELYVVGELLPPVPATP